MQMRGRLPEGASRTASMMEMTGPGHLPAGRFPTLSGNLRTASRVAASPQSEGQQIEAFASDAPRPRAPEAASIHSSSPVTQSRSTESIPPPSLRPQIPSTASPLAVRLLAAALLLLLPDAALSAAGAKTDKSSDCLYRNGDASLCIRKQSFNADLCRSLDHFAALRNLPPEFFARLIWRESLFRPEAVSPRGAEGIAQFMPGTARLRGLTNSFDVIAALDASSTYLDALRTKFGNLGLAAAAYNAGENGVDRFLSTGRLPIETRDYVFAITGHLAETWKAAPPETAAPPLDAKQAFVPACIALADTRQLNEPVLSGSADWAPWGVQLAGHYSPVVADRLFTRAILRLPSPLNAERALIVRQRGGNFGSRPRYAARIGRENRKDATRLCADIRSAGGTCTVFRNR